jgi:hypothetical protein
LQSIVAISATLRSQNQGKGAMTERAMIENAITEAAVIR